MRMIQHHTSLWLLGGILLLLSTALHGAESILKAPTNVQVALLSKLLGTHKGISAKDKVTIYVVGEPKFASAMKAVVGRKLGGATLESVNESELPEGKDEGIAAIYIGDARQWDDVMAYCRQHKILSISGLPELVDKGVTLTVGVEDKKPKVILDMKASKAEGCNWDAEILKVATLINK